MPSSSVPLCCRALGVLLLVGWVAPDCFAQGAGQGYAPLRPVSECLDPDRARSWQMLDSNRLLVDAGRRHYLIELAWSCPELGTHADLVFRSHNAGGRVCGDIGDSIVPQGSGGNILGRCDIARIIRISAEQYAAELRAEKPAAAAKRPAPSH